MRLGINGRFLGARVTGVQRFAAEVTTRLCDMLDDVVLLLPADVPAPAGLPDHVRVARGRMPGHPWTLFEVDRVARTAGCDVVLHAGGSAGAGNGPPAVVVVHDLLPMTRPDAFTRRFALWHRMALVRPARRAAALVAVSHWVAAEAERLLRVPPERIYVVPQGVEPFDRPASSAEVARVRARFGLPDRYVLASGAGDRRKNLEFLDAVFERWAARARYPVPALVVVGARDAAVHGSHARGGRTGADRDEAGRAPTGGGAGVRRLGYVTDDELHALYTGASAFCFPSLDEGFGRPPLEAIACGAPAVVADYGPAREVLGDAATILPLDAERWASELERLLSDEAYRQRRIEAGRAHAARFTWDDAAAQLLHVCRAAAGAPDEVVV